MEIFQLPPPSPQGPPSASLSDSMRKTLASKQARKSVSEVLSNLGYDTDKYEKVDNKANSLKNNFVEQLPLLFRFKFFDYLPHNAKKTVLLRFK